MAAPMTDLCDRPALEQLALLRRKEISATELLDLHLDRIAKVNPTVNAIVDLRPDVGRERAQAVDAARARGEDPGPLGGLVMAHKDLMDAEGFKNTFGTPSMADHLPDRDHPLVAKMRAAGAVAVAKTNTPEFGVGSHTFNEVWGMTRNPYDPSRSAGGSSGGAAVAVATGMVGLADGSDEGGSLRNPAAWASIVGFRPTLGVVPRVGNTWNPNWTYGPMARNVDDLALFLSVLNGRDDRDQLWREVDCSTPVTPLETARVAYSRDLGGLPFESSVTDVVDSAVGTIAAMGWPVEEAEPDLSTADDVFETLRHWRRPVLLEPFADQLHTIKRVIIDELEHGKALAASDIDRALIAHGALRAMILSFFDDYDILVAPVTQVDPFPVEWEWPTEVAGQPMQSYVEWMRSCSRVTVLGVPTMSLPAGFSSNGLPVGLQIIGRPGADRTVMEAAKAIETAIGPLPRPEFD